ncbi:MAG: hypothetical protein JWN76_29 [Chitinophagaceae bacterium]|nr:hypothetical protein [Chitinophagaceae bacterium]
MKTLIAIIYLLFLSFNAGAQSQELQQLKLDIEKLAQYKAMLSEMKQGYEVLQKGYNKVTDLSKSNFDLHKKFLDAQLQVDPAVQRDPSTTRINTNWNLINSEWQAGYKRLVASSVFAGAELSAIRELAAKIIEAGKADMEQLRLVLQPEVLRMTDAERLAVINLINVSIVKRLEDVQALNKNNERVMSLRLQQKRDVNALRKLNGL